MKIPQSIKSEITYARNLVEAGIDGISTSRKGTDQPMFAPALARAVWAPAVVGAAVGVLAVVFGGNGKSRQNAVMGALIGSAVGFSGGVAWASRRATGAAARSALRQVNTVRDAHWLEKNPIAYA